MTPRLTTSAPGWACLRSGRGVPTYEQIVGAFAGTGLGDVPGVKWTFDEMAPFASIEAHQSVLETSTWKRFADLLGVPALVDERKRVDPYFTQGDLGQLYPHQVEAVRFLCRNGGGLLADAMGLGKTRSAAHAAMQFRRAHGEDRPTLILAPKYARRVWRDELTALGFLAGPHDWFQIESAETTPETWLGLRAAKWWFCHPELAHEWAGRWVGGAVKAPRVVILDEAHWYKNPHSRRGKAAHACVGVIPHRVLLTGTPIANKPRELWSLLTLLHGSYSWGSQAAYRIRYCGAENHGYGLVDTMPTNTEELQARMAPSYLRRTIDEVAISLPPLTRIMLRVEEADPDAHRVSPENLRAILAALERGTFGTDTLAMMQKLMKATSRAKRAATAEHVANLVEQDESAVVFAQERQMAERLSADVEGSVWLHGGLGQDERDEIVRLFQEGHYIALFATYGALREGVTLHRARHVILHDLSFVPADVLQAEARVYRIGQRRPTTSTWTVLDGSFDTLLANHLIRKASAIASALQDASAANALAAVGIAQQGIEREARELLKAWNLLDGGAL